MSLAPPTDGDWGWLRQQIEALNGQIKALSTSLANQQSVFVDIAGARTAQLQASLAEVEMATAQIRSETQRLRQLEDAIAHHLHDLVLDVVQPELRTQLSKQLPDHVAAALAPEIRRAVAEWLPQVVAETVTPDVRQVVSEWLPVMVADTVQPEVRAALAESLPDIAATAMQPEVRRVLAERLPHLVAETVQPEVRRTLAERLPAIVAQSVTPEVRDAVIVSLPDLVADVVQPELRYSLEERLPAMVADAVTPEVRRVVAERLPELVAETVQPELRQTLAERLPYLVSETVRPEVRESLDEHLPGVVAQVVNPEVRRTLAERLPELVAETVKPELRQALADALPGIVADVANPAIGAVLAERMPIMLSETISPDLAVTLAEVEGTAAELRQEAAKLRNMRDVVAQRVPEMVLAAIGPQLEDVVSSRFPRMVAEVLDPVVRELLGAQLPSLVAAAVHPDLSQQFGQRIPELVVETVGPELRSVVSSALEARLPAVVDDAVRPELRERLGEHLPQVVAEVITPEVVRVVNTRLPELVGDAISPDLSVSLAEVESTAAEMRAETGRLRSLREVIAERLPQAVMVGVERSLEETFPGRLPEILSAIITPILGEALEREIPRGSSRGVGAPAPGTDAGSPFAVEGVGQLRDELLGALPGLVNEAIAAPVAEFEASAAQLRDEAERLASLRRLLETGPPVETEGELAGDGEPGVARTAGFEASAALLRDEAERLARLREEVAADLPRLAAEAVAAPLAEFEASAAVLLEEAARLARTRQEMLAELPGVVGEAVAAALAAQAPASAPAPPAHDQARGAAAAAAADEVPEPEPGPVTAAWPYPTATAPLEPGTGAAPDPTAAEGEGAPGTEGGIEAAAPIGTEAAVGTEAEVEAAPPAPPAPPAPAPAGVGAPTELADEVPDPVLEPEAPDLSPAEFTAEHPVVVVEPELPEPPPPPPAPGFGFVARPPGRRDGGLDVDPALAAALAPQRMPNGIRSAEPAMADEDPTQLMCALPGVVVGPTLARGIGEAVARARLRRRRRRRAGPPSPGLHRHDPFSGELTRRLEWFALARRQDGNGSVADARPELGTVPVGERDHEEVRLSLVRTAGVCLVGPRAREVARALVLTFLSENDPNTGRAIIVGDLLPAARTFPGLGRTREVAAVLSGLQAEITRRKALLGEAGVEDVVAYQAHRPGQPLPLIMLAAAEMTAYEVDRLRGLLEEGAPTGIVGLVVDESLDGLLTLELEGPGRVAGQSLRPGAPDLVNTRMFTVEREPAAELLEVLASARSDVETEPAPHADESFPVSPAPSPCISVSILGGYRIDAQSKEIRSGLRAKAKELLAFYLLHPEGTTLEEATEALWPEADARRGSEWFWTALGNLRSRLRSATERRDLKVIERDGDRYRIEPVFDVDLWRFEAALAEAGTNNGDPGWIEALQAAADLYTGELLAGLDWPWAEVPREDLRGRAVDVLVSIAATRLVGGDVRGALTALERAVEVDPLAEQLYRRIMRLQAKLSRPDQADATFRALQARLGEIALEPTPESEKLHGELCGTG